MDDPYRYDIVQFGCRCVAGSCFQQLFQVVISQGRCLPGWTYLAVMCTSLSVSPFLKCGPLAEWIAFYLLAITCIAVAAHKVGEKVHFNPLEAACLDSILVRTFAPTGCLRLWNRCC
jgi:hypothetical protein